jgi:hypothetical protein
VILDDGTLKGAIIVNRDVTEEKQAEEALKLSNKKIRLLAGITRHDVRNQMMVMQGYIELIKEEKPETGIAGYLEKIALCLAEISKSFEFMKEYEKIRNERGEIGRRSTLRLNRSPDPKFRSQTPATTFRSSPIPSSPRSSQIFWTTPSGMEKMQQRSQSHAKRAMAT